MTRDITFIPQDTAVQEVGKAFEETNSSFFLIGDWDQFAGIVTRKAVEQAMHSGRGADTIASLTRADYEYLHEDQPLEVALERFGNNPGVVPVLSRSDRRKVEGVITIDTILKFIQKKPS